ncbi:(Fe-S)-binding protein [Maridesulfovibrio ferrireducens]|uniref:(Fe-S)-binding protein n=1 Tax=Maridesulfovibrio ferrireducens TaxID=246191 RepID=UPI001A279B24|nr:(Fe-S)-binding protein [Maridesulfovibrio ferrireducens]MBI9112062.1 (Fe-S)-binding protein [Maridesulfovibrio ferrireducens]
MAVSKSCVQCGKCLEVCPLFKVTGREELTPRAKFFLEGLNPSEGLNEKDFKSLASMCLSCGRCENICPQNMSGPDLVSSLRAESKGFTKTCWDLWLSKPGFIWPMVAALSKFSPANLPEPVGSAKKRMEALFAKSPKPWAKLVPDIKFEEQKVVLFEGCVGRYARRDWTRKAEHFMDGLGLVRADKPDFVCCGSSYGGAGLLDRQCKARKANITAWKNSNFPLVIIFCTTCLKGLKEYSLADFDGDRELHNKWVSCLIPLSSLLLDADVTLLENSPQQVIYHKPCHAPQPDSDQALVEAVAGEKLMPVNSDLCCGFGGILQLGAPELSKQVGYFCIDALTKSVSPGAHILTGCSACVIQLATLAKADFFTGHWLDILE